MRSFILLLCLLAIQAHAEMSFYKCKVHETFGGKEMPIQELRVASGDGINSTMTRSNLNVIVETYVGYFSVDIEKDSISITRSSSPEINFSELKLEYSDNKDNFIRVICIPE